VRTILASLSRRLMLIEKVKYFFKKMEQNPDFYQSTPTSYYYKFQRYMLINADNGEAK
jgi:hypothetical protein